MKRTFFQVAMAAVFLTGIHSIATAADIEWNGFGSLYYGQTQNGQLTPFGFGDSRADFGAFSFFGLNVSGRVSDRLTVAAQFLAQPTLRSDGRGNDGLGEWGLTAKWAYATYAVTDDVDVKLGRQLLPTLIGSEFESVGYLLPYRQIPALLTLTNGRVLGFNGISGECRLAAGILGRWIFSAYVGREDFPNTTLWGQGYSVSDANLMGATATLDGDGYRARVTYSRSTPTITVATNSWQDTTHEVTAGARYDKHNVVLWGEWMYFKTSEKRSLVPGSIPFVDNTRSGYVLLGYRIGDWMPRYVYSEGTTTFGEVRQAKVHNLGLNYQIATQAVLKLDYEYHKFPDSQHPLGVAYGQTGDHATAVYAGVDFIF